MTEKNVIIIGGGPAGLTAAYEFLDKTDVKPIVYEASGVLGGIAKTVNYKGNRIDIGGHRFFSKSDRVMDWWLNLMPIQRQNGLNGHQVDISYQNKTRPVELSDDAPDPEETDNVMLVRSRLSRILYGGNFYDYPVSLNAKTIKNLGLPRIMKIGFSYLKARAFPIKEEKSLEDFFINRFGRELYLTFFKDYTEKVWGVRCDQIEPEWGAQRIKGLSLSGAVMHAIKQQFKRDSSISQKNTETSLIERFIYPKLGPGQMWEQVACIVEEKGGEVNMHHRITGFQHDGSKIRAVEVRDQITGETKTVEGDYFISTMPITDLIKGLGEGVPHDVTTVADGLKYRDFVTVGVLAKKLKMSDGSGIIPDNWIYVQEPQVKVGRLQIFNNWSPYLVADPNTVWVGCEYFCNEGDELWNKGDDEFGKFAVKELAEINFIDPDDVLDYTVLREPKTYPAYFGTYTQFDVVREYIDEFENLFLVGRNGMHRYNNQDHSMLTAMTAVENIANGVVTKDNIWSVNVEQEYHESK